jgi:hypothetical protein
VPRPAFHDVYDRLQGKEGNGRKDGRGVERRYVKEKKKNQKSWKEMKGLEDQKRGKRRSKRT